ncbi:hypothetical protein MUK70_11740 [Dyadobacter chenwenxiniae]|uniref:Uncharacterized protein n=1 Tax=Dyadobacter chenwenxiniae TaxID=2906456 RepID=A0A9X1PI54_9BACT|nr:hypothetical protein [Dyadobacter chenwenxiniae]MCF0059913.1 hypothetical protein [Dyadobacter chenwenxiniae]UON85652.1 hypothetical protein MUK70_11740 [Dyadobacter chenwenxiniae]
MPHVPIFWKEKNFMGWRAFLKEFFSNQKAAYSVTELVHHFAPSDAKEQARIRQSIGMQLSVAFHAGELVAFKLDGQKAKLYAKSDYVYDKNSLQEITNRVKHRLNLKKISGRILDAKGHSRDKTIPVTEEARPVRDQLSIAREVNEILERTEVRSVGITNSRAKVKPTVPSVPTLVPREVFKASRLKDIECAIRSSVSMRVKIPTEWIEEYNELI